MGIGLLSCPECSQPIASVDVSEQETWIKRQVGWRQSLNTRKQSACQSDYEISHDGLAAELAAAVLLCPANIEAWRRATETGGGNRGRDFLSEWTGLDKPVEVKQTTYRSETTGYLLVRPPRMTPGRMLESYIDDCIYMLLWGKGYSYTWIGWTDRVGLLRYGQLNPVPMNGRQRECWGIHWKRLYPIESLVARFATHAA